MKGLWVSGIVLLAAALLLGCGPDPEHRAVMKALNEHPKLVEKGGFVKDVSIFKREGRSGGLAFEADVWTEGSEEPVGFVEGRRLEGFGTVIRRFNWYLEDDKVMREEPRRNRDKQRGRTRRFLRGETGRGNKEAREPAE